VRSFALFEKKQLEGIACVGGRLKKRSSQRLHASHELRHVRIGASPRRIADVSRHVEQRLCIANRPIESGLAQRTCFEMELAPSSFLRSQRRPELERKCTVRC